ncbi:TraR/DksA C4-type zinc finger protein [Candidatus Microgenomates bacterium]|nr:TraR/DksA C4-type zinc finger protein [Candidatus Microgenomates bacterium]
MKKTKKQNKKTPVKTKVPKNQIRFPARLLRPVAMFLRENLNKINIRTKNISSEDPFVNTARIHDNASPDADAEEQFGHARVTAIKEELNKKSTQIKKALKFIKKGKYGTCEDCQKLINTDRLSVVPEATLCVSCEKKREK